MASRTVRSSNFLVTSRTWIEDSGIDSIKPRMVSAGIHPDRRYHRRLYMGSQPQVEKRCRKHQVHKDQTDDGEHDGSRRRDTDALSTAGDSQSQVTRQ